MNKSQTGEYPGAEEILEKYGDMLYRLCLVSTGNAFDAEDAIQETMLAYLKKTPVFNDSEHCKAWLITVATNKCRDILRHRARHPVTEYAPQTVYEYIPDSSILSALMQLDEKYRTVMALYYIEGFRIEEIAKITGKTKSAIKMRLQKGRKLMKEIYEKEYM